MASDPEYNKQYENPDNPYNNHLFEIHAMKCLKMFISTKCGHGKNPNSLKRENMAKYYAWSKFPENLQQDMNPLQKSVEHFF